MIDFDDARRRFTTAFGMAGVGLVLAGANSRIVRAAEKHDEDDGEDNDKEVGAVEDLMREHGVIRRAILMYRQAAVKLRANPASVVRSFGEDYHEKKLEETHIFPAIKKAGIPAAVYVDILIAQHQRGREITDYVLAMAAKGAIGTGDAEPLARALESIELVYEHHAAREDTVVFPAWKDALTTHQLHEMSELFEDIEHRQFGEDGFGDAVEQIGKIEQELGTADISLFTAPPPPKT